MEDPNSEGFYIRQELRAHQQAVQRLLRALVELEKAHPNLAPKVRALRDQAHEDLCWND